MPDLPLEPWRRCWRLGVVPELSTAALQALARGLADNDEAIIQGETVLPTYLPSVANLAVEAACPLSYAGWQGDGLRTVGEVEEFFEMVCGAIDLRLDEGAGCRWFINWVDETPRDVVRSLLLEEVELALNQRMKDEG